MIAASDPIFRRNIRHLHRLGPRPIGEVLAEVISNLPEAEPVIADRLATYAELDPALVDALGGADWLDARQLVRAVEGGQ
jgi:hypothetical protein